MTSNKLNVVICILTTFVIIEVHSSRMERILRSKVFANYSKDERPVEHEQYAVNLTLDVAIFQIIKLNEKDQTLEASAWLRQTWYDKQLTWEPKNYHGIKQLSVNPENMWLPDTVLYNSVMEDNEIGGNLDKLYTRIVVRHTGEVRWMASAILKTHCNIKVAYFPFDSQQCELRFVSWTYATPHLIMMSVNNSRVMDTDSYEENSVWHLRNTSIVTESIKYKCCEERFSTMSFQIYVARRSLFYLLNLVFPISMITLLTILSFLLPAESGERISLAVTLLLAITFIMLIVADHTPATSQEIPLVSLYFIISMIDMVILMITVCYVNRLHHKETSDGVVGYWTRRIILDKLSYIVGIQSRTKIERPVSSKEKYLMVEDKTGGRCGNSSDTHLIDEARKGSTHNGVTAHVQTSTKGKVNTFGITNGNEVTKEFSKMIENIISEKLSQKIDKIVHKVEGMDKDDLIKTEWRMVAMTVDRCLLIFFLFNFVATLIGVFSLSPGYVS